MENGAPGPGGLSGESRQLNVSDALGYLDAVKLAFQEKPECYNHFLDIMRDFKSHVIDTLGVIERISVLFRGNLILIQGFNTFLPPGYRIEHNNEHSDTITVTTPMGQMSAYGIPQGLVHDIRDPIQSRSSALRSARDDAAFLCSLNAENSQNGEFHYAVDYLSKIKSRLLDDPEKYKQFLEILQKYGKEQRHVADWQSQVYAEVQVLFRDAPDLREEFREFLSETAPQT
ncbi:paired amphipathic helix [Daedaleopsis nitida]|nr:paired amphipathic helix [Daedaleopsis nitida]